MTEISTTRFGKVQISTKDLIHFPQGLVGFETCQRWILLGDSGNEAVGWLQSATQLELAMPVISPRRFVADYRFHVSRQQLEPIDLNEIDRAFVLVIVAKTNGTLTANLKAPLIVNLDRRLGCQILVADDYPIQHALLPPASRLRKSA